MAKGLLNEYLEGFSKSSSRTSGKNRRGSSKVDSFGQEYRFELGLLLIAGVVYGAFFVATHRSPAAAGAMFGFVAIVGLFVGPIRRTLRRNLYLARVRRNWDRAIFHCEFKHKVSVLSVEPVSVGDQMRVRVGKGISFPHLDRQREALAASLAVREVRIKRDPHNAATGTVTLVKSDPLAEVAGTTWPGMRHFHGGRRRSARTRRLDVESPRHSAPDDGSTSIWDPIQIGVGEHGPDRPITVSLPERNLLIGGNPGSGKSSLASMLLATAALDPTCKVWLIDGKMVEFAEWEDCAETFAHRVGEANFLLASLKGHMDRRYQELRKMGERNIRRDLNLPLHVLFVDELSLFTTGGDSKANKEFTSLLLDVVARGRAAGIIVIAATQKPEGTVVATHLRDLFAYKLALSCGTPEASDTILGRGWSARGYDASTIAPGEPGVGFLRAEEGIPVRFRGFYLTDQNIRSLAAQAKRGRGVE